ncbi:hypothetical protein [Peribacillus glennii]|uniref:hypothetical protein n=1 Tax=Peribacillus glennii TaxID=2303991 RepID=UPI00115D92FC|nr:hypothetical protein [Peribacillus glennii]
MMIDLTGLSEDRTLLHFMKTAKSGLKLSAGRTVLIGEDRVAGVVGLTIFSLINLWKSMTF